MAAIDCPYLGSPVVFTDEREAHIAQRHPDLLPSHRDLVIETVSDPDTVRRSERFGQAQLFSRWYAGLIGGKHVVAVVTTEPSSQRHWLVTSYISRKLTGGDIEWQKS